MDISNQRKEYRRAGLQRCDLAADPIRQFAVWLEEAQRSGHEEPTAMILATVDESGQPSQRTVLLKYFDHQGFVFYTNYGSRKAAEISGNDRVSLLFLWLGLERQVIIGGRAGKVSAADSARYFMSRPKGSQIAAWVSHQSHGISSRQALLQKFAEMKRKFGSGSIPLPSFWGGYRVRPETLEFWQGRENRLHDRFIYRITETGDWDLERLMP